MTNFDFFKIEPQFNAFVDAAVAAEKIINIDPAASILNCRRAMETAIKWMYSVDSYLEMPYKDSLASLIHTDEFKDIVDQKLWYRLDFIRRIGNTAAHGTGKVDYDQAELCLRDLFIFFDFLLYCYSDNYKESEFDPGLLKAEGTGKEEASPSPQTEYPEIDIEKLIKENKELRKKLTEKRKQQEKFYNINPIDISEYKTRKIYIDFLLADAGWVEGQDWINEVELTGMPNASGVGYADYILYDDAARPLAVIEAKKHVSTFLKDVSRLSFTLT